MTIAVTGATGGLGSRVLRHLMARGDSPPVVALARRPEAVPVAVPTRRADYDDPAALRAALVAVRTLVFISSDGVAEIMLRHHHNVIDAAAAAGVDRVVYTGIIDTHPGSGFYSAPVHRATEAALAATGLSLCLARTSVFADFFVSTWIESALADGTLALPARAGRMSLVTRDDVALAVAAAAVTRREGVFELTGPAALTTREACEHTALVTGRPLRFQALDEPTYRRKLASGGAPPWLADAYASMFAAVEQGRFAALSTDVEALTGTPPHTYADFVRRRPSTSA
jgi:NAD(P)H dehydrogenase (quinone)